MRKLTIFAALFTFVLFTSWSVALGSWVSFNGGGNPAPPQIEVLGSDGTQTTVHITVPGMVVEDKEVDGQIYQVLRIPDDNATMLDVGKPELPAIRKLVGIPPTCNVTVSIVNQSYAELDGYLVYPFQEPLMEGEEPGPFVIDTALYETDSFYPQEIAEVDTPAVWRDVRVTRLSLYPVTFNPVTGILRVYDDLTVQLNYSGTDGVNPLVNPPPMVSPSFNKLYMSALINYDYLNLNVSDLPLGYLIISPLKYLYPVNFLADLADWKEKKGIPTFIEEAPEGCNTSWVKNAISQYYEELGIEYVLLVGTVEDIPLYKFWKPHYNWLGDFGYTLIAGDDTTPDVAIGRLSVYSDTDVSTNVNKIFAYERYPDPNWNVTNALFVCYGDAEYPEPEYCNCKQWIISHIMDGTGFTIQTAYGEEEGVTNQTVIDAFQSTGGLGIVNYRGHGWEDPPPPRGWYQWNLLNECFTPANANALLNPNRFPVVYNISCQNGAIQLPYEVLAEAFCNNPNGGGSGALGATEEIKTYPNSDFDRALFEAPFDSSIFELGNIINYAKIRVMKKWDWLGLKIAWVYLWLGDPEMQLWTEQPKTLVVDHPQEMWPNTDPNVTVTVTHDGNPVDSALVCLCEPHHIYLRALTDEAGQATFPIPSCDYGADEGTMSVTVTKHNFRPYEGDISIHCPYHGCPFLFTWNRENSIEENNLLPLTELPENEGKDISDYYHIQQPLVPEDGNYKLEVREFEQEHSWLDQVQLMAVDHPADIKIAVSTSGKILGYRELVEPIAAVDSSGGEFSKLLSADDGLVFRGKRGDELMVGFRQVKGIEKVNLVIGGTISKGQSKSLAKREPVLAYDPASKSRKEVGISYRQNRYVELVELQGDFSPEREIKVRLLWQIPYDLDFIGLIGEEDSRLKLQVCPLDKAFHSANGPVLRSLFQRDQMYGEVVPGEKISLVFSAPKQVSDYERDFVLVTTGHYAKIDKSTSTPEGPAWGSQPPTTFSLGQSYPNPFNSTTVIRYQLPTNSGQQSAISLKIYNIEGQLVRTLVDGQRKAGRYEVNWDGCDSFGKPVSSGIYFYRLQAGDFCQVRKMVLLQ